MKKTSVVVLTGSELRHDFFRMSLALRDDLDVPLSICERKATLERSIHESDERDILAEAHAVERRHSETDFFSALVSLAPDMSNPVFVPTNSINADVDLQSRLRELNPDFLVCYGTSIIRDPVLSDFGGRFLNIHLGLSPYYRGGGTNFWPLVNGEPEFIGVTFMHIDAGVDTGDVVHQLRATMYPNDTAHSIGNRLIRDTALTASAVIRNLPSLRRVKQTEMNPLRLEEKVYRRRDFSGDAVAMARLNLANGLIDRYLEHQRQRDATAPIVEQWDLLR